MKLAIFGAGNVGGALARNWIRHGHQIVFGLPRPSGEKIRPLLTELGARASATDVAEAAAAAEVVVLATPWAATENALSAAGASLSGKILLDCTNPLTPDLSGLSVGRTDSGGEQVARWAPQASVFKALNQTGADNMFNAPFASGKPVMFVCGDDQARKPTALELVTQLGFEAIDAGNLASARMLEPYALLWIHLAYAQKLGRRFAFGILRR